jgi:hypothetical protein
LVEVQEILLERQIAELITSIRWLRVRLPELAQAVIVGRLLQLTIFFFELEIA